MLSELSDEYLYYGAGSIQVLKMDRFTYCLMGCTKSFVNLTGCKTFEEVIRGAELFYQISSCSNIINLKIDSITFTYKLKIPLHNFIDLINNRFGTLKVKTYPRFSGVNIKCNRYGWSCNYFKSTCKIVGMGCRNISQVNQVINSLSIVASPYNQPTQPSTPAINKHMV